MMTPPVRKAKMDKRRAELAAGAQMTRQEALNAIWDLADDFIHGQPAKLTARTTVVKILSIAQGSYK